MTTLNTRSNRGIGFAHQAAGMHHEIAQQCQELGPQGDGLVPPPQVALRAIQTERPKTHGGILAPCESPMSPYEQS